MPGGQSDFTGRELGVLPRAWFYSQKNVVDDQDGLPVLDDAGLPVTDGTSGPPILQGLLAGGANVQAFIYALLAFIKLQARISTSSGGWLDLTGYDFFGLRLQRAPGQSDASWAAAIVAEIFRKRNTRAAIAAVLEQLTGNVPVIWEPWRIPDSGALNVTLYYGAYGVFGSRTYPFQVFITAYRGNGATDAQIYAALESVRTAGITYWVSIQNP